MLDKREYEYPQGYSKNDRYILTSKGEVIRINEYCCRLANNDNVHVVLFGDTFNSKVIDEEKFLHPSVRGKDG